jgi:AraC-like DNA-binding protein
MEKKRAVLEEFETIAGDSCSIFLTGLEHDVRIGFSGQNKFAAVNSAIPFIVQCSRFAGIDQTRKVVRIGALMSYDHSKIVVRLQKLLADNIHISLLEASQQLGVERHTVEKALKQITGRSFREYRQRILLDQALRLLVQEASLSTKEIAAQLGYGSGTAFSRFVRRQTGRSPTELRQQTPPLSPKLAS